jgi:hypothetical protein
MQLALQSLFSLFASASGHNALEALVEHCTVSEPSQDHFGRFQLTSFV